MAQDFGVAIPVIALVLAAFTVPYGLLQLVVGPVADRVGKARVLITALLAYAAATAGCAMAQSVEMLTVLRAMSGGASAGLIPVCLAYIGDTTPYQDRQLTLSRFLAGVVFAQILAGPIGGVFGEFISWRGVFVCLAVAAVVLAAGFSLHLRRHPPQPPTATQRPGYAGLLRHRSIGLLLLTAFDGVVFTGTIPFIAPYLHEQFGLSFAMTGIVLAFFGIGTLIYVRGAPWLIPRLGEPGLVAIGALFSAVGMIIAALGNDSAWIVVAEISLGLGYFMLHSVLQARATEMLPDARSIATSAFAFMLFMGQAAGTLLCVSLMAYIGYRGLFAVNACGMLLLGALLWRFLRV